MNRTYKSFHVKNRFLSYYFEKIKKENINTLILLDMHIHMDDLNEKTGEDIKEFISKLEAENYQIQMYPLPLCIFNFIYPEKLKKITKIHEFKFFFSGSYIKSAVIPFDEKILKQAVLFERCKNCKIRMGVCKGIFRPGQHKIKNGKWDTWIKEIEKPEIKVIDIGSGMYDLETIYKHRIKECDLFVCLGPSYTDIVESSFIAKSVLESKSSCILGVGEHIPFKENFFDLAILSYVYSHFFSLDEALKELHRILKLGGKAIILEERHNDNSKTENTIRYGEKNLKYKIHYTDHSLDQSIKELEKHGFYVLDSFEVRDVYRTLWGLKVQKH